MENLFESLVALQNRLRRAAILTSEAAVQGERTLAKVRE